MANMLDEVTGPVNESGRDANVIEKQLPVKVGVGSIIFEVVLWVLGIIPGLVFLIKKIKAAEYFRKLEQRIQHDASQIDNYLEQRVMILQNTAQIMEKAIELDKTTLTEIAAYRGGKSTDAERNEMSSKIDNMYAQFNVAMENYPELKAHDEIKEAMRQNSYLQREITAAREIYNDTINHWNRDINIWPVKMIVAAKQGYTTRIPFSASKEIKQQARSTFFGNAA